MWICTIEGDSRELEDLEADITANNSSSKKIPSKRDTCSTTRINQFNDVTLSLGNASIAIVPNFFCTYMFPLNCNKTKEGFKDIVFLSLSVSTSPHPSSWFEGVARRNEVCNLHGSPKVVFWVGLSWHIAGVWLQQEPCKCSIMWWDGFSFHSHDVCYCFGV